MTSPRFVVRSPADGRTEHRTLLAAMKAARALVQTSRRGVVLEDHRAGVTWRAIRIRSGRFLKVPAPRGGG